MSKLRDIGRGAWMWMVLIAAALGLFYLAFSLSSVNALALLAAGVVFAALVVLFVAARRPPAAPQPREEVKTTLLTPTVLVQEIRAAALVTYGQIGQVTVKKERNRKRGEVSAALLNPFIGEELVMDVGVRVIAGVNLKHLREEDVRVAGESVEINLPPTKVLMVYVDESLTRVVQHQKGWLSAQDFGLMDAARREAMEGMVNAAIEKGLFDKAGQHAAIAITAIARSLGFQDIRVFPALPPIGQHFEDLQDPETIEQIKKLPLNLDTPAQNVNDF